MGSGSDSTAKSPFLPLSLRLQGETRTPRQTPAPQPRAHWRRAWQPEPINGRRAGSRARAHLSPRAGRSEARSRPLDPHVTRQRGAPLTLGQSAGSALLGAGKSQGEGPGSGRTGTGWPPSLPWMPCALMKETTWGTVAASCTLGQGNHKRLDSSNSRQNHATRLSCLPCVVWPFKGSVPPSLVWALLCKTS